MLGLHFQQNVSDGKAVWKELTSLTNFKAWSLLHLFEVSKRFSFEEDGTIFA